MSKGVSVAGMTLSYAVETTAGSRPTEGYIKIPEVKTMPSFNPTPDTIETTPLDEMEWHTYTSGLKDTGGAMEYTANMTDELDVVWENLRSAYETGQANSMSTWFCVQHPKITKANYFTGEPIPIGMNEASVGSPLETTLYIMPNSGVVRTAKPTDGSGTGSGGGGSGSGSGGGSDPETGGGS